MKYILFAIMAGALLVLGCTKVQEGFLSDGIRYKSPEIFIPKGITARYPGILFDGSTPPVKFEILDMRPVEGGKLPAAFNTKYPVWVFKDKMSFDPDTDTTIALLRAKQDSLQELPFEFNPVNGGFLFKAPSANLPNGVYEFDVKASNVNGSKVYKNLARLHIEDPEYIRMTEVPVVASYDSVTNTFPTSLQGTMELRRVSPQGTQVMLKIMDKNGKLFNPKKGEVITRGDRPSFASYARFNPVVVTDTALITDYAIAPYPAKLIPGYVNYLIYYRIPAWFIKMDGAAPKAWSANPRFGFQILFEGTYEVIIHLPNVTKL
ncbi:uncharacterized protein DUF5007 [Chitinophaga polysaccharea]|uniref:Uncharacterized protein DUF5007 n=1 Tax=Chitinophaga polysaccharea TaxID=1293035 RepID=A0A561PTN7_9BACT|nr:DUF5007 domain-containing protein [Chitinophaga polysaccharea]TWF41438.1 uncharacterized protein DUF5007 [Chitinophaga polysaccharea]